MASDSEFRETNFSEKVKDLHGELVDKLGATLAPVKRLKTDFDRLLYKCKGNPLSDVDMEEIDSMQKLFDALMKYRKINYGDYQFLDHKLERIHEAMRVVITEYTEKIEHQIKKEAAELAGRNAKSGTEESVKRKDRKRKRDQNLSDDSKLQIKKGK